MTINDLLPLIVISTLAILFGISLSESVSKTETEEKELRRRMESLTSSMRSEREERERRGKERKREREELLSFLGPLEDTLDLEIGDKIPVEGSVDTRKP